MFNNIREVIADKDLLFILAKRDITVRYKQTTLGILWAVIRPIATMFVFIFAFSQAPELNNKSEYPLQLLLFSGILIWNFFANTFQAVSNSLLVNSNLISKVYFPRLIIAFSSISVALLDLLIGLAVYAVMSIYFNQPITIHYIYLPIIIFFTTLFSVGLGLITGSYSIKYRDILQIIPLVVQYGFFISPVIFTAQSLIDKYWFNYYLIANPIVGFIEMTRSVLLINYSSISIFHISITLLTSVVVFIIGIFIFTKRENAFVDHL
jgi:lipopolysaccharide transport system permease protein